jgi:hypothetical protein
MSVNPNANGNKWKRPAPLGEKYPWGDCRNLDSCSVIEDSSEKTIYWGKCNDCHHVKKKILASRESYQRK